MKFYAISLAALLFAGSNTQSVVYNAINSFDFGLQTPVDPLPCTTGQLFLSGKCTSVEYIQGCLSYKSQKQCSLCQPRYDLQSNGLCYLNQSKKISCCTVSNTIGCTNCTSGLYLTASNSCKQSNIVGCISKDSKGICTNCATGFKLNAGKCDSGVNYCKDYLGSISSICLKCQPKYSLVHNLCIPDQILGCVGGQQKDNICSSCILPFSLVNGKCKVDNCKVHNQWGCAACQCGYFLKKDKTCQKYQKSCIRYQQGVCTDCKKIFTLDKTTNKCYINGCLNDNGKICLSCQSGYILNNTTGQCDLIGCNYALEGVCKSCDRGYKLSNVGNCILFDTNAIIAPAPVQNTQSIIALAPTPIQVLPSTQTITSTSTSLPSTVTPSLSVTTSTVNDMVYVPQESQFTIDASMSPVYTTPQIVSSV